MSILMEYQCVTAKIKNKLGEGRSDIHLARSLVRDAILSPALLSNEELNCIESLLSKALKAFNEVSI